MTISNWSEHKVENIDDLDYAKKLFLFIEDAV